MRKVLLVLALMFVAIPASADEGDWISCFSVNFANGEVAGTNGDWLADGSTFTLDYTYDGDSIAFEFGDGSAQAHALTPEVIDATACEDGSVFLNERAPGQDPSWLEPTTTTTTTEPVAQESPADPVAEAFTLSPQVFDLIMDVLDSVI